jgi:hypothetical protein
VLDVAADQALAFRIAAHHLDRRVDATQGGGDRVAGVPAGVGCDVGVAGALA